MKMSLNSISVKSPKLSHSALVSSADSLHNDDASPGAGADAPGHLSPVVVSEALSIAAISALLDPELPAI